MMFFRCSLRINLPHGLQITNNFLPGKLTDWFYSPNAPILNDSIRLNFKEPPLVCLAPPMVSSFTNSSIFHVLIPEKHGWTDFEKLEIIWPVNWFYSKLKSVAYQVQIYELCNWIQAYFCMNVIIFQFGKCWIKIPFMPALIEFVVFHWMMCPTWIWKSARIDWNWLVL